VAQKANREKLVKRHTSGTFMETYTHL